MYLEKIYFFISITISHITVSQIKGHLIVTIKTLCVDHQHISMKYRSMISTIYLVVINSHLTLMFRLNNISENNGVYELKPKVIYMRIQQCLHKNTNNLR